MHALTEHVLQTRSALLRMARARLRNSDWAEEAVSETILAALEKPPTFEEPGRVRAWLFGTLRHKVVDQLRAGLGETASSAGLADDGDVWADEAASEACPMAGPEQRAMDAQFLRTLQELLQGLPSKQAQAFVMSECAGLGSAEICQDLGITEGHLWVLVHRARHKLRTGLVHHR